MDGRTTRCGRFVRADVLSGLPDESHDVLFAYGVRTVVDLRTTEETIQWPCSLAADARFEVDHCNLEGDEPIPGFVLSSNSRRLANAYAALLAARGSVVRDVFATLAGSNGAPAVFFCAGGTDRTGMIAALVLGLCGVGDESHRRGLFAQRAGPRGPLSRQWRSAVDASRRPRVGTSSRDTGAPGDDVVYVTVAAPGLRRRRIVPSEHRRDGRGDRRDPGRLYRVAPGPRGPACP